MQQKDKSILFVAEQGNIARPLYRAENPAKGLRELGWRTIVTPIMYETEDHKWTGYIPGEDKPQKPPKFIVAHILNSPQKKGDKIAFGWEGQRDIIDSIQSHGQKFFFDLDDDIWNLPAKSPAHLAEKSLIHFLDEWVSDINHSSGLICSTGSIAEMARKNGVRVPIHVLHNTVDIHRIEEHIDHFPLRICWPGNLDFREDDFVSIIPDLYAVFGRDYGFPIEFWHLGASFDRGAKSVRNLLRDFPAQIVERPWVSPREFREALGESDIVILPAVSSMFNDGRSNVVGLECMAAGIPFLASPIREYKKLDNETECIAPVNFTKLEHWIENSKLRRAIAYHAQMVALETHTPKFEAFKYQEVFSECLNSR